ncbi:hypothetical protein BKD26_20090 [Streptomyces sp. CB03238]|nr:hypothetical protein BKD26_20090 [Streptomyces sp. CB03238]
MPSSQPTSQARRCHLRWLSCPVSKMLRLWKPKDCLWWTPVVMRRKVALGHQSVLTISDGWMMSCRRELSALFFSTM